MYSLRRDRPVDLVSMRQHYGLLGALFDAEYGSATYAPAAVPAILEIRVSTTGLLVREVK